MVARPTAHSTEFRDAADRFRFAAGWRVVAPDGIEQDPDADISVDIIRPDDLISLSVEGFDVELSTEDTPLLRATSPTARLVVRFAYQHLGEEAIYEDEDAHQVRPPVPAVPSRGSRLVFALAEDEKIEFTTAGVLDAMRRLPLIVHPLAAPRTGATRPPTGRPVITLPGNIVVVPGDLGAVIARARARDRIRAPSSALALAAMTRGLRRMRDILTYSAGTAVRIDDEVVARLAGVPWAIRPDRPIRVRRRPRLSRPAETLETMIEAPFRLEISPSAQGGWAHSVDPVGAEGAPHRVELWHTRLGVRAETDDGPVVDERLAGQRIIRAVWARDREAMDEWAAETAPSHVNDPFRMSLDGADRHMLVRQSAEAWLDVAGRPIEPTPVDVRALALSSLGAWLDLHGRWDTTRYPGTTILAWDHIAPMGRDQYVRVEYPGYLFPFGHRATLVKLTERKMKNASPSVASLYQRMFLVVGEPTRWFDEAELPFDEVRLAPLVTPTFSPAPTETQQNQHFFPMVGGARFRFILHCIDREGRRVRLQAPLLWVSDAFEGFSNVESAYENDATAPHVPAAGQEVAYAPPATGGDTMLPTDVLTFGGTAAKGTSTPHLDRADVVIPAVEQLSPIGRVAIKYATEYLAHGFGGAFNVGEVWAALETPKELTFGDTGAGSDKAGGFVQPNLKIAGLSRVKGTVGDITSIATGGIDVAAFLAGTLPKLFGVVRLVDVLGAVGVGIDDMPTIVTQTVERIEGFAADLERAIAVVDDAVGDAERLVARAQDKAQEVQAQAEQARTAALALKAQVDGVVPQLLDAFNDLVNATKTEIENQLTGRLQSLRNAIGQMPVVAEQLPPLTRQRLLTLADALDRVANAAEIIEELFDFLNGLAGGSVEASYRFEWTPVMRSWPPNNPILELTERSFVLAVEGRASGTGSVQVDALAELRDFTLNLLPGAELVRFTFDHLSFRAGSTGKPDVDLVLHEIEFLVVLGFVEVLKELIPFDGFSDPPFLDVTDEGLTAGFSLALPSVAVGVFNLSNVSLGADVRVPFLGQSVTVGFDFCTRERPFTLAVLFIGGGGWFGLRISPDGLDVLEMGLEAGAILAVDFGVASGSISAMLGIYLRLEADEGSLAGYFRLRGEVDVLGLISASIELYLELRYEFATGKMVGSASLTIKVEVLFFSTSVTIRAERRFAGSNGDPTFLEVMGLEPDGTSSAWSEYCLAFAG